MSSGSFAGEGASAYVKKLGVHGVDRNLRSASTAQHIDRIDGASALATANKTEEIVRAVQAEVAPYNKNLFRTDATLKASLQQLDQLWTEQRNSTVVEPSALGMKAREAMAMTATARWMYNSALARTETRGMHKREDHKALDENQRYRLVSSGLDSIKVRPEQVSDEHLVKEGEAV